MVDGSPFALMAPTTMTMLLQSPDDYYERWVAGSFCVHFATFLYLLPYFFQGFIYPWSRSTLDCFRQVWP
ncbi:spore germination protein [[Brevibacterium] frigoritolerans]|uniref:Spore germination protein n=1 Tax=Peribacillus frigoritolerans TaxID=450367 RepID=A0A941FNW5_9BACI|nr:spore germination protein [Peribacillus frigoritolerans]